MERMSETDLLDELTQFYALPPVLPGEVIAEMLAERIGCTKHHASEILRDEEKAGRLISHDARTEQGRRVKAYRRA